LALFIGRLERGAPDEAALDLIEISENIA